MPHRPLALLLKTQNLANLAKMGDTGNVDFVFQKAMIVVSSPIFSWLSFYFIAMVFALFYLFLFFFVFRTSDYFFFPFVSNQALSL